MIESQIIYNGICLPSVWPPVLSKFSISYNIPIPYYILNPPKTINIDIGRQLFVDDFLIDKTTCKRSFHRPEAFEKNPIIFADKTWEKSERGDIAMPYSDGVWYDPDFDNFKMVYVGGDFDSTCLATSMDGINWEKPILKNKNGTNIIISHPIKRDSASIIFVLEGTDKEKRIKMICWPRLYKRKKKKKIVYMFSSPNGIDWIIEKEYENNVDDRNTAFYNPFRKIWIYSIRGAIYDFHKNRNPDRRRARFYGESKNFFDGYIDCINNLYKWTYSDPLDEKKGPSHLYNLDIFAYESLLVGQFNLLSSAPDIITGRPKINQIFLGFSRDGFSWDRTNREVFIPVSEEEKGWNWGNVQSVGGFLVVKDKLYFYCSGRNKNSGSTGLYFLRRDGFASMDSDREVGYTVTKSLKFSTGKYLFVNVEIISGFLLVQITDTNNNIVLPFEDCTPIIKNNTAVNVGWKNNNDLSFLNNKEIKIHFKLLNGKIYSFWVSESLSGISNGYLGSNKVL